MTPRGESSDGVGVKALGRVNFMGRPVFISSGVYNETGYRQNHPLGIPRLATVHAVCQAMGWLTPETFLESPVASVEVLERLHHPDYVAAICEVSDTGRATREMTERYNIGNMENPGFRGVFQRAATSVGGSIFAAEQAVTAGVAYHPAGGTHHGRPDRASGFCYFNDPAFAILRFQDLGLGKVLYVDLDAHHGDGVQDFFETDARVRTVSIHEKDRWPGTGGADDTGKGYALNLPVPPGFNDTELDHLITRAVLPFSCDFAPDAMVVTVGADALAGDPLSKLALSNIALWRSVEMLLALSVPTVVLGGGGYNPWTVARCWAGLWARISGQAIPTEAPPKVRAILEGLESDLVDEDEIEPKWLTAIADTPNPGKLRPEVAALLPATETAFT